VKANNIWKRNVCGSEAECVAEPRNPGKENNVHLLPSYVFSAVFKKIGSVDALMDFPYLFIPLLPLLVLYCLHG
jgi:hypothetical protein